MPTGTFFNTTQGKPLHVVGIAITSRSPFATVSSVMTQFQSAHGTAVHIIGGGTVNPSACRGRAKARSAAEQMSMDRMAGLRVSRSETCVPFAMGIAIASTANNVGGLMRIPGWMAAAALATLAAVTASGTTFVVPEDEEMVDKATAIVIGTVEGSYVQERDYIETVYELRVERALKGAVRPDELLRIVSIGGALDHRGTIAPGSAHFVNGERVLLFLTFESQRWQVTDLILGKFRFSQTPLGEHVLLRDEVEISGWDRDGTVHRERVRREDGFLRFIEQRVRGRGAMPAYFLAPEPALPQKEKDPFSAVIANAPFRAYTYTDNVQDNDSPAYLPSRWSNIAAGVQFYKTSSQNISGAADGGVSVIQNGLAAWNNECGSVINLIYAGQRATGSTGFDDISVVEFNDPQNRIAGSWGGAGTVATTFISYNDQHNFDSMVWWSICDADVVFQNGYTAANASFATAMTYEIGHGI